VLPAAAQAPAAALYLQRAATIRAVLGDAAVALWDAIEDPGELASINAYADTMARLSAGAQRAMAESLAGYLQVATGDTDDEWDADELVGEAVREEEGGLARGWSIPAFSMWKALGQGMSYAEAHAQAREDVRVQAETDLALAQRESMRELAGALDPVIGYRRIVGGSECEFCTLISDRLYHDDDLMPVHPNCNCGVLPVLRLEDGTIDDPGGDLDGEMSVTSEAEFEEQAHTDEDEA
jgi:hypothetical protein